MTYEFAIGLVAGYVIGPMLLLAFANARNKYSRYRYEHQHDAARMAECKVKPPIVTNGYVLAGEEAGYVRARRWTVPLNESQWQEVRAKCR